MTAPGSMRGQHLLSIEDLDAEGLTELLDVADVPLFPNDGGGDDLQTVLPLALHDGQQLVQTLYARWQELESKR